MTGKILNPQQDYLTFTYYADWVSEPREYTLTLNKDQEFLVEFPLKEMAYCDISFGEHGVHLLKIEPGDSIHLMFDQDDFNNTLRVEGPGSHKWAYQLMLRQRFEVDEDGDRELSQFNSPRYFEITQKWLSLQNQLLDQQTSMVSPEFAALQKADILGKVKLFELGYLNNKNSSDSLLQLDWNQFPEHIKAKSIYMGQVADALVDNYLKNKRTSASRTLEYEYLKLLKDRIGTGLTEKVLATKLLQYLDTDGMSEEIKLLGEDFMYFAQNDEYKKVLATQFRRKEALAVGKAAPNFIVQNKKGN